MSCPSSCAPREGRREFFCRARQKLRGDGGGQELGEGAESDAEPERGYEFDAERIVARVQGREGWRREADRQLERQRWEGRAAVPSSRQERLLLAAERLEDDLGAERAGNEAYQAWRAAGIAADGSRRMAAGTTKPYQPPEVPAGKVNITDPDSKVIPDGLFFVQGYNAQAAVNEQQIVLAAEITNSSTDFSQLDPIVTATLAELERAGVRQRPEVIAADAGYWNEQHMDEIVANKHIPVLVAPDKGSRGTPRKTWTGGRYDWMRTVLSSEPGGQRYRKRRQTVEPMFGNIKHNKGVTQFLRRGRVKVRTEAVTHDDPQPHQAPQPPNSRSGGLKRPPPRDNALHSGHATNGATTTPRPPAAIQIFTKQPLHQAALRWPRSLGHVASPNDLSDSSGRLPPRA